MQNIRQMHHKPHDRHSCFVDGAVRLIAMFVFAFACLAFMLFARPSYAWADNYTSSEVIISADIQSDGSLHVIEQRNFSFSKETTDLVWNWWKFPDDSSYEVNGIFIAVGDDEDDVALEEVPAAEYDEAWEDEAPEATIYAIDEENYKTHLYLAEPVDSLQVRYDYTVYNALDIYDDYASLSWKYVDRRWNGSSENVVCTISFPVPLEAEGIPNENLFAWGHGPDTGSLAFDEGGTSITYTNELIEGEQYAQAHILIPSWWLSNAKRGLENTHHGVEILDKAKSEELEWHDDWCVSHEQKSMLAIRMAIVTFVLIALAALLYLVRGKSYKPDYGEEYTCQIPDAALHPVLAARLWRWNRSSVSDMGLCLLDLVRRGAIAVNYGSYRLEEGQADVQEGNQPDGQLEGRGESQEEDQNPTEIFDYYLSEVPEFSRENIDPIDENALFFLFNEAGEGEGTLWLNSLYRFAEERPRRFAECLETWQELLDERVHDEGYFDQKSLAWQMRLPVIGGLYLVVTAVMAVFVGAFWPLGFGLLGALALFLISNFMPRRSKIGADLFARQLALRNWLEAPLEHECAGNQTASSLRELALYAWIFNIEDEFMTALRQINPRLFEKAEHIVSQNEALVPWLGCYSELQSSERKPVAQTLQDVLEDAYRYAVETAYAHWGADESGD